MAIVDSKSAPASGTNFNCNADCHIIITFTNENLQNVAIYPRYEGVNDKVQITCRADGGNDLRLGYNNGSYQTVRDVAGVFPSDIGYKVDIYCNGTNVVVEVDDVEKINETVTHNETVAQGNITHTLATNDIELESWPYGEPVAGTDIAVTNVGNSSIAAVTPVTIAAATAFTVGNVGNSSIAGYNPNTTIGTGLWEVGAYIYDVIGEIHVNVGNVGAVGVDGFNPATLSADTTFTVGNVGGVSIASPDPTITFNQITSVVNVGAVAIAGLAASVLQAIAFTVTNVGRVVIAGLNADVAEGLSSAASGITRIAMKMATILRR